MRLCTRVCAHKSLKGSNSSDSISLHVCVAFLFFFNHFEILFGIMIAHLGKNIWLTIGARARAGESHVCVTINHNWLGRSGNAERWRMSRSEGGRRKGGARRRRDEERGWWTKPAWMDCSTRVIIQSNKLLRSKEQKKKKKDDVSLTLGC